MKDMASRGVKGCLGRAGRLNFSGENCCFLFILVYLMACFFIGVKVGYWGKNWGIIGVRFFSERYSGRGGIIPPPQILFLLSAFLFV